MLKRSLFTYITFVVALALDPVTLSGQDQIRVASPNGRNTITVETRDGRLYYSLRRYDRAVILPSQLGFEFRGAPPLRDSLRVAGKTETKVDQTWAQPRGEVAPVRDQHNEARISVSESAPPRRRFIVVFRVLDDGAGFQAIRIRAAR